MHVVIRKFSHLRSVRAAAQRAETGLAAMLTRMPGFLGYYIFDAGDGVGGSVTFFEDLPSATLANERAMAWVRASIMDLSDGEPEIITGDVLYWSKACADGLKQSISPAFPDELGERT